MKILFMIVFVVGMIALTAYLIREAYNKNQPDDDNECPDCDKPPDVVPVPPVEPPVEPVKLSVTLKPNNPPEVPDGVFCTRTLSISAIESIGCSECSVVREWYDNDVLRETGTTLLIGYFNTGHVIKYRLIVDGTMAEATATIT
jgi:hypothetical protein